MIFENLPNSCIIVILISLLIGWALVFLFFSLRIRGNSLKSLLKTSLMLGTGLGFAFAVIFCSFVPTLVTVDSELNHKCSFSLYANGLFIGVGGSYILNNSPHNLRLVGISGESDINVPIKSGDLQKVRRCPQRYFVPIPEAPQDRVRRTAKGKKKSISGPRVFLIVDSY